MNIDRKIIKSANAQDVNADGSALERWQPVMDEYDHRMLKAYQQGYGYNKNDVNFKKTAIKMLNYVNIHQINSIPFMTSVLKMGNDSLRNKYVLEFGCNTAATAVALALEGAKVVGVDPDAIAIDIGNIRIKKYGLEDKIRLMYCKDCSKLKYIDETFDIVTCVSVFEYIKDVNRGKYITELSRVLKKGGILFILETSNGLYPIELHSKKWFINYFPRIMTNIFHAKFCTVGITYWQIRKYLDSFTYITNIEGYDQVEKFLENKKNDLFSKIIAFMARGAGVLNSSHNNMPREAFLPWLNLAFRKQ
ncbi:MAG: class I SAM-dependent methyltransferase [Candidatus Omnitrophota bacterium]